MKWSDLFDEQALLTFLKGLPDWAVYLTLLVSSVIENVFPPWPGDTVTVIGGVLASFGVVSLPWSMLALVIGNLIGAYIMYFMGSAVIALARRTHARMTRPVFVKEALVELTSDESMQKTEEWFRKWGAWFVLVSRFSAGVRFFVSIIAGISKMPLFLFSVVFTVGVLLWNTLLLGGGYLLGRQWDQILVWLRLYNTVVISIIVLVVVSFVVWRVVRRVT